MDRNPHRKKKEQTSEKNTNTSLTKELFISALDAHGPQEISAGVYLGSVVAGTNLELLKKIGITHILVVAHDVEPKYINYFYYCHVKIPDHTSEEISYFFPLCIDFMNQAVEMGGKVLVHCIKGKSRSATVCIAYLMYTFQLTFRSAHNRVQKARQVVHPNEGFVKQLERFERTCPSTLLPNTTNTNSPMMKQVKFYKPPAELLLFSNSNNNNKGGENDISSRLFYCNQCQNELFHGSLIIPHKPDHNSNSDSNSNNYNDNNTGTDDSNSNNNNNNNNSSTKKKICSFYFLKSIPWISEDDMVDNEGSIYCSSCYASIGSYCWSGIQCTCNYWVVPALRLYKSDVCIKL